MRIIVQNFTYTMIINNCFMSVENEKKRYINIIKIESFKLNLSWMFLLAVWLPSYKAIQDNFVPKLQATITFDTYKFVNHPFTFKLPLNNIGHSLYTLSILMVFSMEFYGANKHTLLTLGKPNLSYSTLAGLNVIYYVILVKSVD